MPDTPDGGYERPNYSDEDYNSTPDWHNYYRRWYNRNVLRYARPALRGQIRGGGTDQIQQYRNAAVSSEAQGNRDMMDQMRMATTRNFGGNPTGMMASMPIQAQLASKRPVIELQAKEAGKRAVMDAINRLQAVEMGMPQFVNSSLQPHFQEENLDYLWDSLFPPMGSEEGGGGGGGIGDLFGGI